jgi:phosphatidylserine/phosphatidylglycerophosphate/cardiolipin synthase-like enzyme
MTKLFLRSINERPGFRRLYLCSPWISLDQRDVVMLAHAVLQVQEKRGERPEIVVIVRPEQDGPVRVPASVVPLRELGATIFLNSRLHTKLYIREPDSNGGYAMAIVGSQNLTKSSYIELGLRINSDSQMIYQLIAYFWEITYDSYEIRKEQHEW